MFKFFEKKDSPSKKSTKSKIAAIGDPKSKSKGLFTGPSDKVKKKHGFPFSKSSK